MGSKAAAARNGTPPSRHGYQRKMGSRAVATAAALVEAAAKKKTKKTAAMPHPKATPRATTSAAPMAIAPTRAAAAVGNKKCDRRVLDEMPTRVEMNTTGFLTSLESLATVGLDELNYYDSFQDHLTTQDPRHGGGQGGGPRGGVRRGGGGGDRSKHQGLKDPHPKLQPKGGHCAL
ncbi:uncharacterized protein LOC123429984 [Hordeum vulgare subsp. vulgare]|uniref:uncharacterized protein LOC123429984 n=1 Tax=Hordeum vulgare subsp. vulgare TaxID=112509 RepID=UPI00162DD0D1|nr:uncharacterized protein LOC123429984 [Hordeum vulgare subsp. vulgare]